MALRPRSTLALLHSWLRGRRPSSCPPPLQGRTASPLAVEALESRMLLSAPAGRGGPAVAPLAGKGVSTFQVGRVLAAGDAASFLGRGTPARVVGNPGLAATNLANALASILLIQGFRGPGYPLPLSNDPALRIAVSQPSAGGIASPLQGSPLALAVVVLPGAGDAPVTPGTRGPTRLPLLAAGPTPSGFLPDAGGVSGRVAIAPAGLVSIPGRPEASTSAIDLTPNPGRPDVPLDPGIPAQPFAVSSRPESATVPSTSELAPLPSKATCGDSTTGGGQGRKADGPAVQNDRPSGTVSAQGTGQDGRATDLAAAHIRAVARPSKDPVKDRLVASLLAAIYFAAEGLQSPRDEREDLAHATGKRHPDGRRANTRGDNDGE
jgi:hypothetical protein